MKEYPGENPFEWLGFAAVVVYGGALIIAIIVDHLYTSGQDWLGFLALSGFQQTILLSLWPLVAMLLIISVGFLLSDQVKMWLNK